MPFNPSLFYKPSRILPQVTEGVMPSSSFCFFDQPGHVFSQVAEGIYAFVVFLNVSLLLCKRHVPVSGCGDGHLHDAEEKVYARVRKIRPCPAHRDHTRSYLAGRSEEHTSE